jgi:hypothetical protein
LLVVLLLAIKVRLFDGFGFMSECTMRDEMKWRTFCVPFVARRSFVDVDVDVEKES